MAYSLIEDRQPGGFSFENCYRNKLLESKGYTVPKAVKTGTTICGVIFKGHIGAALILGGVDSTGPHLYSIAPHGSSDKLPYLTMGSGSLAAMSVLEHGYKPDMNEREAVQLVRDAIASGIFNDLGSGSNVDVCIITKDGAHYNRPYEIANIKGKRAEKYVSTLGTVSVLKQEIQRVEFDIVTTRVIRDEPDKGSDAMDTV